MSEGHPSTPPRRYSTTSTLNSATSPISHPHPSSAPVVSGAPHSAIICKYITPKQCLTVSAKSADLCYIIQASGIDDKALMAEATEEQVS